MANEEDKNAPVGDAPVSVSALVQIVKDRIKDLSKVYVSGEISDWKVYPSGHAYFKLKDADAQLSCAMFNYALNRCKQRDLLKNGAKVVVIARLDVYAPRGECQLVVLAAKIEGVGDLLLRLAELKRKLQEEGVFDRPKKKLPFLPHRIGIVTSPAGAVIHDMGRTVFRRFPNVEITLFPVKVQGDGAPEEIAAALKWMDAHGFDVVIVGRGGGSFEDLLAFNEECVVRAVADMRTPVVSAVGHQTDFSLCDFAADVRAGTPSIAAEMIVPVKDDLVRKMGSLRERLAQAPRKALELREQKLDYLTQRLADALKAALQGAQLRLAAADARLKPALDAAVARARMRLAAADAQLKPALDAAVAYAERRLAAVAGKLPLLDPENPLKRGYTLTLDAAGKAVRSAAQVKPGDAVVTRTGDGSFASRVVADAPVTNAS